MRQVPDNRPFHILILIGFFKFPSCKLMFSAGKTWCMRNALGRLIAAVVLCALAGPPTGVAAFSSRLTMSGRLHGRRVLVTGGGEQNPPCHAPRPCKPRQMPNGASRPLAAASASLSISFFISVLLTSCGAGRGIGRAIALLCAEEGARVAILARTKTELDAVAVEAKQKLGSDMVVVTADVTLVPQFTSAVFV